MQYDLELKRSAETIIKQKAKKVLIQLPEGLKPRAKEIVDFLNKNTDAEIHIWGGSCFGACDIPHAEGYNLMIQWGHNEMK